jgi:sec-independent protein translocase protein TatA
MHSPVPGLNRPVLTVSGMTGLTQPWHIILILLIALMLFGGRKLPEVGRSLGTGMREFKDSITGHSAPENDSVRHAAERESA